MTPAEQLNPAYWTKERIERIRRTSARTYTMHVLNEFGGAENALLTVDEIGACIQRDLPPGYLYFGEAFGGFDPSSLKRDGLAYCIAFYAHPNPEPQQKWVMHDGMPAYPARDKYGQLEYHPVPERPVLRIAEIGGWSGKEQLRRTTFEQIADHVAARMKAWGAKTLFADSFGDVGIIGHFSQRGVKYHPIPWSAQSKESAIGGALKRAYRDRGISQVPHAEMERHLLSIRETPRAGDGSKWSYPTGGLDYASALIAIFHALEDPDVIGLSDPKTRLHSAPHKPFLGGRHVGRSR